MNEIVQAKRHDDVVKVFEAFFSGNMSLSDAIEAARMSRTAFYAIPEEERTAIAHEVREKIQQEQDEAREAQRITHEEIVTSLRRKFYGAAEEALDALLDVMRNAQSDFVREKAAVDVLNYTERNFDGEKPKEEQGGQLPAPAPQMMLPVIIMPDPKTLQPATHITVVGPGTSMADDIIEGVVVSNSNTSS